MTTGRIRKLLGVYSTRPDPQHSTSFLSVMSCLTVPHDANSEIFFSLFTKSMIKNRRFLSQTRGQKIASPTLRAKTPQTFHLHDLFRRQAETRVSNGARYDAEYHPVVIEHEYAQRGISRK